MTSVQNLLTHFFQKYPLVNKRHLRVLLSVLMGESLEFLMAYPETKVPQEIVEKFQQKAKELENKKPLSRILGYREFWGMNFDLSSETLDPRSDSEILIEATLKHCPRKYDGLNILDLGTGTGCLIISLLKEYPNALGVAIDQSNQALKTAQKNAETHNVMTRLKVHSGDWFKGIKDTFDIIISNPPYITDQDYESLDISVKDHDPKRALIAGLNGLDCYKKIIKEAPFFLKEGGGLVLEIGQGQGLEIEKLLKIAGLEKFSIYQDLASIDRCFVAQK
ncbi:peptide chain release factor N(5)-glutamine methyltransferase [Alphaproteobacteria bacterium]|nr:peptide chain release factor N(5)-glutamine methyltransferase [Alphaproteobacteria bacterium]